MVIGGDCYPPHQYHLVIVQQGNTLTGGASYATEKGQGTTPQLFQHTITFHSLHIGQSTTA